MLRWLAALIASSFTFALADVLCDICITETNTESADAADGPEDAEQGVEMTSPEASGEERRGSRGRVQTARLHNAMLGHAAGGYQKVAAHDVDVDRSAANESTGGGSNRAVKGGGLNEHIGAGLSGEQDAAIAGLVTVAGIGMSSLYWLLSGPGPMRAGGEGGGGGGGGAAFWEGAGGGLHSLKWSPWTHVQFWFAMLGGAMAFLHYFFLLKVRD